MVHRLRPRAHRLFGQRRRPRLRQFAGDDEAGRRRRAQADRAQQRGAGDQDHRWRRQRRLRAWAVPRRRRSVAGDAGRLDGRRRLRLSEPEGVAVRPDRSRRRRPRRAGGLDAYVFTERGVYRTGETVHVDDAVARRGQRRRRGRAADARGDALRRRRISPQRRSRSGHRRPRPRRRYRLGGADRDLARRRLHRSEAARRSARRHSSSRTTSRTGSNSTSPPQRPASRRKPPRRSASTAASSMARRPRASVSTARSVSRRPTERPGFAGYRVRLRRG